MVINEKVVGIDDYRPIWTYTKMECNFCIKKWVAVHQTETTGLECPRCGKMTAIKQAENSKPFS